MTDALVEAEELLKQLPDAVSRRRLGERLGRAILDLRNADHQMKRIAALMETAKLTEFGKQSYQADALDEMIESTQDIGEALESAEDPEALRSAVDRYSNDLGKAISALDRLIQEHWTNVAREKFRPLVGVGGLLGSMNVPRNLGSRLIDCGNRGVAIQNISSAPERHDAIAALLKEYEVLSAERAAEIPDNEVGEFINALADKQATLAMVTNNVRQWLADHGALDRLGITTR